MSQEKSKVTEKPKTPIESLRGKYTQALKGLQQEQQRLNSRLKQVADGIQQYQGALFALDEAQTVLDTPKAETVAAAPAVESAPKLAAVETPKE